MPTVKKYQDVFPQLRDYLFYIRTIRGHSQRTVDAYYIDLKTFFRYIRKLNNRQFQNVAIDDVELVSFSLTELQDISLSDVYSFLNYTIDQRDNESATRARKVSSIRSFFKYLTSTVHVLEDNPVKDLETPRIKKTLPKYLTLEESIELMNSVTTAHPERDYCIIVLLLNCGLRLSELVGIDLHDIRDDKLKVLGKGNKERMLHLNSACVYSLTNYFKVRTVPPTSKEPNALFMSQRGTRLSPRRVQQIVEECLENAGLGGKGYSPHKLRHTAATLMHQHGEVDIRVIQEVLGHENLATTEIYTHIASAQIEQAVSKSPLAEIKIQPQKSKNQEKLEKSLRKEEKKEK